VTRRDIIKQLGLSQPKVFVASFDRPNISLTVQPGTGRVKRVLVFLQQHPNEPGIVYCLSRKQTETLADKLKTQGYRAAAYHAGLGPQVRAHAQRQFLQDDLQIICATVAFGMGIDKGNVRWVIHYNLPKNIEGYYQEIGRAGRDGAAAAALLLYSYADVAQLESMLSEAPPAVAQLNRAKLERMRQYAEASHCRRKILLHYFGETREHECGNCDVCQNPPVRFDGTEIAQKALSGVVRLHERAALPVLIDVLRGLKNMAVINVGGDKIKTWGAGRDLPYLDWYSYLHQLLNAGLLHIAYDEGYALRIHDTGWQVLRGERKVELARFQMSQPAEKPARRERGERGAKAGKGAIGAPAPADLFDVLKRVRKQLADSAGVPPYVVFSDATLQELAATQPTSRLAMLAVSGVGPVKFEKWGEPFINAILDYVRGGSGGRAAPAPDADTLADLGYPAGAPATVPALPKRPRLSAEESRRATWELHQLGQTAEQIAEARQYARSTIVQQLGELYAEGYAVRMAELLPRDEYRRLQPYFQQLGPDVPTKDLLDALGGPEAATGEHLRLARIVYKRTLLKA
ncbi:MAG: RecQ family ATP-dependent DNA helicase, partial [Hymenobacteraceae bacterium]|nr:RecQ family ATP-dependent DNA helicase [Hymenobacteraceae bacterium]